MEHEAAYVLGRISGVLIAYRERLGGRKMTAEQALSEIEALVNRYMDHDEPVPFRITERKRKE